MTCSRLKYSGCQSEKIGATVKHFVANDVEKRRRYLSAEIDERTLREIYLLPFQLIIKDSAPWCLMTRYLTHYSQHHIHLHFSPVTQR